LECRYALQTLQALLVTDVTELLVTDVIKINLAKFVELIIFTETKSVMSKFQDFFPGENILSEEQGFYVLTSYAYRN